MVVGGGGSGCLGEVSVVVGMLFCLVLDGRLGFLGGLLGGLVGFLFVFFLELVVFRFGLWRC